MLGMRTWLGVRGGLMMNDGRTMKTLEMIGLSQRPSLLLRRSLSDQSIKTKGPAAAAAAPKQLNEEQVLIENPTAPVIEGAVDPTLDAGFSSPGTEAWNEGTPRERSIQKLVDNLGFNPMQDLYGLKSMSTEQREVYLQETIYYEELERRRKIDFPQLKARAQPWVRPPKENIFEMSYHTYVEAGNDPTNPRGWKVKFNFKVRDLARQYSLDAEAVKKVKLIAGSRYNPETESIKLVCKHRASRQENRERIEKTIARLVHAAKTTPDKFDDIPVEAMVSLTRKPTKPKLVYPESWKNFKKEKPKPN